MQTSYELYATRQDLLDLLRTFEESTPVQYALSGAFREPTTPVYTAAVDIEDLGTARRENSLLDRHYLILPRDAELRAEPIAQQNGGTLFYVDASRNPEGILLVPGGIFQGTALIAGTLGMNNLDPAARRLFRPLARLLRDRFTRIGDAYVGPEALALLQNGFRLTSDADPTRGLDLQLKGR
jgi:hypothetical protein